MKAFLSHSSLDKEFVREVAANLGRLQCVFDEKAFISGDEFKTVIENYIEKSTILVFFASKEAINSFWCKFELDVAFYAKLKGKIQSSLVYLIGEGVSHKEIPSWMTSVMIKKEVSPSVIARDIVYYLNIHADEFQDRIFIGRSKDREMLENALNPVDGSRQPKVISITGLPGIGRRTLIKKSVKDLYSLNKCVEIDVEDGDNVNSLCAKLADIIEPYSCQEELRDIVAEIMSLDESDALVRILRNLELIVATGELPLFVDYGGLIIDNGCLVDFMNKIIDKSLLLKDLYFVLILTRKVSDDNNFVIPNIFIDQLSDRSTAQLIAKLAQYNNVFISQSNINDLIGYVCGYPPSAYFAIKQAKIYSVDALISDKRKLNQFSQKRFIGHLNNHNLTEEDANVLTVLASFSPLPLTALVKLYSLSVLDAHDRIYEMIDCSLIRVENGQLYRIADPIKAAVNQVYKYASSNLLVNIIDPLNEYIKTVDERFKLELSRVLFRLGFFLKDAKVAGFGISLNADFIKLLEDAYHQRKYKEASEIGFETLKYCPDNGRARTYLVKSLIQEERWDAAQQQIDDLFPYVGHKDVYYLQGFMNRKRGDFKGAIESYKKSEDHKFTGFGLYREFSHCYLMLGDLDSAKKYILKALSMRPDNNQVIDIAARIAIKERNEVLARRYLDQLEILDTLEHYYSRLSAFYLVFGHYSNAYEAAKKSVDFGGKRFFSGRVQLIKSLTKLNKFAEADAEMSSLDHDYPRSKNDIKVALRCALCMEKFEWKQALLVLDNFINKSSIQYRSYRKKCLEHLITDVSIKYAVRLEYKKELEAFLHIDEFNFEDIGF